MDKPTVPLDTLRDQIADAIAVHVSAHNVPRTCVAVGIQQAVEEGDGSDAFRSKRSYVKRRLLERSKEDLLQIATTAAERGEKAPVPLIDELEVGFHRLFDLLCGCKRFSHPVYCRRRRVTLSCGGGSLEQRGDFAQLLAEFLFSGH